MNTYSCFVGSSVHVAARMGVHHGSGIGVHVGARMSVRLEPRIGVHHEQEYPVIKV
jgi:hypothetical protein